MKKNIKILIIIAIIILILSLIVVYYLSNKNSDSIFENQDLARDLSIPNEELTSCTQDSDCVLVTNGYCSCGSAGGNIAINKQYQKQWNNTSPTGPMVFCPATLSEHHSCYSDPICSENECKQHYNKTLYCEEFPKSNSCQ
ncbi:MAG: sigma factor regulator N-terminal domain-containing protein [Patescibacteria group bacterium]